MAAALTVLIMAIMKLPVFTSQAVVGAIIGLNLLRVVVEWGGLIKVLACWIGIPLGVVTYSKPVMTTVGGDIVKVDAFMAFVIVPALSVTV